MSVKLGRPPRDKRRPRVFENRVLRDEVTGEWRKLHNKELNDQYSSLNIVRVIKEKQREYDGLGM